jgi:hypothetical protein
MRDILVYLKHVPEKFKTGPWCLAAHMYIFLYFAGLTYSYDKVTFDELLEVSTNENLPSWISLFRLLCSLYCFAITVVLVYYAGLLPLASYTLTSWNLLTLRLFTAFLGDLGYEWAFNLSQVVLFPALVGCSITCTIWWLVLTPLISNLLKQKLKDHVEFWKWNTSFFLLNLHGMMLVFAATDYVYCGRHLVPFDLWLGLLVAFVYVLFYLLILDPLGFHFYIILTPRTSYCVVSYSLILLTYYSCYLGWNNVSKYLNT